MSIPLLHPMHIFDAVMAPLEIHRALRLLRSLLPGVLELCNHSGRNWVCSSEATRSRLHLCLGI